MRKLLLIEDNAELRETLTELFELEGYDVLSAPDGRIGMEMAIREFPDLILCDIIMPVLDGVQVYKNLLKDPVAKHTPFIFLTSNINLSKNHKMVVACADDYITKPFDTSYLLKKIEARIDKRQALKQAIQIEKLKHTKTLHQILLFTSHSLRKPTASCLGLMQLLDPKYQATLNKKDLNKIFTSLEPSILEFDNFVKQLTMFVCNEKDKNNGGL